MVIIAVSDWDVAKVKVIYVTGPRHTWKLGPTV